MSYITLSLPFSASGRDAGVLLSTAWLFKIASHRMLDLAKRSPVLPATDVGWSNTFRKPIYEVIPNRRYADGVITLVRGVYESCRELGIDFREVELGDWLMFQQAEKEYPVRNITLKQDYSFSITTSDYNGDRGRVDIRPKIPKNYGALLKKILDERVKHTARVVIRGYGVRKNSLRLHGEVQLIVSLEFYYRHSTRYRENSGNLYGGVDINTDRVNLAIVDENGRLRDVKTFWFEELTARGYSGEKARAIIGMKIHGMLRYAYHNGIKTLFLENPEALGILRMIWIRGGERLGKNYNWKVSIFRNSIIEMITLKAPLYSIKVAYVNPKGTTSSEEHKEIMKRHGLDRHSASAYLIALKGLATKPPKQNQNTITTATAPQPPEA